MRRSVDHTLVIELLEDESLSFREIARRANCSDFAVRAIARKLDAFPSDDQPPAEPLTIRDWCIVGGIAIVFFGGVWFFGRWLPPSDGTM